MEENVKRRSAKVETCHVCNAAAKTNHLDEENTSMGRKNTRRDRVRRQNGHTSLPPVADPFFEADEALDARLRSAWGRSQSTVAAHAAWNSAAISGATARC